MLVACVNCHPSVCLSLISEIEAILQRMKTGKLQGYLIGCDPLLNSFDVGQLPLGENLLKPD